MPAFTGRQAGPTVGGSALVTITASTLSNDQWDRLAELQRSAQQLLAGLDELGLSQAAAYASMALDVMRQSRRSDLLRTADLIPTG
jgi:predicted nucleotidyltransferase